MKGSRYRPRGACRHDLFRQFLLMLLVVPVTGGMTIASHSVIGEKQARTREPRTAQQIGLVVILPLIGLVIGQFTGMFQLELAGLAAMTAGLAAIWVLLLGFSIALSDRESILIRWQEETA